MSKQNPYIRRKPAEELEKALADALAAPGESSSILFHVWGIGGIGKSTLLGKLADKYRESKAGLAKFDFKGRAEETPLKVMAKLYEQLPKPNILNREVFDRSPFAPRYEQYCQTLRRLESEPIEGRKSVDEDQRNLVKELGSAAVFASASLLALSEPVSPAMSLGTSAIVQTLRGTVTGMKAIKERLLQRHPATKTDSQLQELMLEPIPQLTKAFVAGLVWIQKPPTRFQKPTPMLLLLDHLEKSSPDLQFWLELLLEERDLQSQPIRILAAGRYSLRKKLSKSSGLIFSRELEEFDKKETKEYLKDIGIEDRNQVRQIYGATDGFPFHLDLIRQQKEEGRPIKLSRDNKELADRLMEGLDQSQKQVVQLAAYLRWFDEAAIQYLMAENDLDFETAASASQNCFQWLLEREFVIEEEHYRLNDVARDVLRRFQCKNNQSKFHQTHAKLAQYFQRLANEAVHPEAPAPDKYESPEWREFTAESIYHALFANRDEGQRELLTHFFAGAYLNQVGVATVPFAAVAAEAEVEDYRLLPGDTRKFLKSIRAAIERSFALGYSPDSYEVKDEQGNSLKSQTEAAVKNCLSKVDSLDGLAKYAGLTFKHIRSRPSQQVDLLLQAQEQAEQIATPTHPEFSSRLFWLVGGSLTELGRNEEGLAACDRALELDPDSHDAWNNRGVTLRQLGRLEEAVDSYDRALAIKPDYYQVWNNRGNVLFGLERYEEAVDSRDRALAIKPDYYQVWNHRGAALVKLGQYQEALESYNRALAIKPDYYQAWSDRGVVLYELGRYEEALDSYDRALAIKPDDYYAWNNRGNALNSLGRYEEAVESCDRALAIKPDDYYAWNNRGNALNSLGRYEEAVESCDRALGIKSNYCQVWTGRSAALKSLGRYKEALENSDRALQIDSDSYQAWTNRSAALNSLGRYEEAVESCDRALQIKPDSYQAWTNRSAALNSLGRYEEAVENCDRALQIREDLYQPWSNRGWALNKLGRYEKALDSYDLVLKLEPKYLQVWMNRGVVLAWLGRYDEAIENCDKALSFQPKHDGILFYGKACCYALQGKVEEAVNFLQQAIRLNPEEYRKRAAKDTEFDGIREEARFQALWENN
ncbi:MAG: tetratricopeptide repeat protein [Oscillatoria sp. SIO1A7]|nr:tetratricopeptide repeat protein [Oscillatoria sp. SIO1A7]